MKKQTISICALMLALAAIMNVTARANAFTKVNYPKILKAEYAGKELSKDIQNPTILPLLSKEIPLSIQI